MTAKSHRAASHRSAVERVRDAETFAVCPSSGAGGLPNFVRMSPHGWSALTVKPAALCVQAEMCGSTGTRRVGRLSPTTTLAVVNSATAGDVDLWSLQ